MNAWTASAAIEARSVARRAGLTRLIQRIPSFGGGGYEAKVRAALQAGIREGDTVWDVGANIGLYTCLFSEWVGPGGRVVAFEPVPDCFAALCERATERANIDPVNVGLADVQARLPMQLSDEDAGTRHSFSAVGASTAATVELDVAAGDDLRRTKGLPTPNVLKIDVEGFEFEALQGLDATLREPTCRMVLCEIHFAILEARGFRHRPREIEDYLDQRGFLTKWIDASHLGAYREARR
jgi:FkbM family methyltransferase